MDTKNQLFRYLYYALIGLRANAYERGDQYDFAITNLLHNLPLQLLRENVDYDELLEQLKEAAANNKGLTDWLNQHVRTE